MLFIAVIVHSKIAFSILRMVPKHHYQKKNKPHQNKITISSFKYKDIFINHFTSNFKEIPLKTNEIDPIIKRGTKIYDTIKTKQNSEVKTFLNSDNELFVKASLINGDTQVKCDDKFGNIYVTDRKFLIKEIHKENDEFVVKKTENCKLKLCVFPENSYLWIYHFIESFDCSKINNN